MASCLGFPRQEASSFWKKYFITLGKFSIIYNKIFLTKGSKTGNICLTVKYF